MQGLSALREMAETVLRDSGATRILVANDSGLVILDVGEFSPGDVLPVEAASLASLAVDTWQTSQAWFDTSPLSLQLHLSDRVVRISYAPPFVIAGFFSRKSPRESVDRQKEWHGELLVTLQEELT